MNENRGIGNDRLFLLVCLLIATALRLHLLIVSHFVIDSDEAIVGIMAKHILEGKGIPVFYYGQHYMGSLEAILASGSFWIFGINSWALKLVPLVFSIGLIALLYQVVFEISDRATARMSVVLMACAPSALIEWSSKARGGFIEVVFLGLLAFLFFFRFLRTEGLSLKNLLITAFCLGVGWWVNNQVVYFMVPVAIATLGKLLYEKNASLKERCIAPLLSLLMFFVGGLPYWIYNFQHKFISFEMLTAADKGGFSKHLPGLFQSALPILWGAKRFWHDDELFTDSINISFALYGFVLALFIFFRKKEILKTVILRFDWIAPWEVLLLFVFSGALIFTASSFGYLVQAPRYLLPLYVGLFPLIAFVVVRSKAFIAIPLFVAVFSLNILSSYYGGLATPGEPFVFDGQRVSHDHTELLEWLRDNNIHQVRTNYWIGYRLAFESKESVIFDLFQEPRQIRIREYEDATDEISLSLPLIVVSHQGDIIRKALKILHWPYKETVKSEYVVFYEIGAPPTPKLNQIPNSAFEISTNTHPDNILNAIDGDLETRWGSGKPQTPGMEVRVKFKNPEHVSLLRAELGKYCSDYPREIEIEAIDALGEAVPIFSIEELWDVKFFVDNTKKLEVPLPDKAYNEIVLRETGQDKVFDWSIAELKLFEK